MISFIAVLIGYICGSIPFGLLLTKAAGLGDVRSIGSGNIGATNVLRTGNKKIAALTLFLDGLKGAVPVLLLTHFGSPQAGMIAGLAAMAGHIFPLWLGFKGGKGVATSLGVLAGLMPMVSLAVVALWLVVFKVSGYVSLASIVAALALPVLATGAQLAGWGHGWPSVGFGAFAAVLVVVRHRGNIQRLRAGTENRFGKRNA